MGNSFYVAPLYWVPKPPYPKTAGIGSSTPCNSRVQRKDTRRDTRWLEICCPPLLYSDMRKWMNSWATTIRKHNTVPLINTDTMFNLKGLKGLSDCSKAACFSLLIVCPRYRSLEGNITRYDTDCLTFREHLRSGVSDYTGCICVLEERGVSARYPTICEHPPAAFQSASPLESQRQPDRQFIQWVRKDHNIII